MILDCIAALVLHLPQREWNQKADPFRHHEEPLQDYLIDQLDILAITIKTTRNVNVKEIAGWAFDEGGVEGVRVVEVADGEGALDAFFVVKNLHSI